jgi:ubiquinone/menaquinone biosynthesis C-methylase UbiE
VANLLNYKTNILDIGVGNGLIFPYLRNKNIDYTGLDISLKMLEQSIERAKREGLRFHPVLGNVLKLPFESNSFNSVICTDTLHHLEPSKLFMALEEIIRVTNKNGQIIIEIKNSFNLLLCLIYWLESKRKSLPLYPINPLLIIKFLKEKKLLYRIYFVGLGFWLSPFIVFDIRV